MKTIAHFHAFAPQTPEGLPEGWETWTPRPALAPRFSVEARMGRTGQGALCIACGRSAAFGGWKRRVEGIVGGRVYRFTAYCRARNVPHARHSIAARLDWFDSSGQKARPSDYVLDVGEEDGWTKVEAILSAPDTAKSVGLELSLRWAAGGTVYWDDITLAEEAAPRQRLVRAATIYHRPRETKSAAESVQEFCRLLDSDSQKPDIVCLPEGITLVGTGKSYAEVSEPLPGPTTQTLGALAKKLRCYIVAGIFERVDDLIYNTAVLIGRGGEIVGTYRKTHLPREEFEAGITPGDSYPVFQTDFGKIGLMICWDVQFPEPARALALQGAEMILLPIWGGSETLAEARAIENHVFLVSSSYDMKTCIIDPTGKILAEANAEHPFALAEIDLDRHIIQPWLGNMKTRTWKERRPDIPMPEAATR